MYYQFTTAAYFSDSPPTETTNPVKAKMDLNIKLKSHQVVLLFTSNFTVMLT